MYMFDQDYRGKTTTQWLWSVDDHSQTITSDNIIINISANQIQTGYLKHTQSPHSQANRCAASHSLHNRGFSWPKVPHNTKGLVLVLSVKQYRLSIMTLRWLSEGNSCHSQLKHGPWLSQRDTHKTWEISPPKSVAAYVTHHHHQVR